MENAYVVIVVVVVIVVIVVVVVALVALIVIVVVGVVFFNEKTFHGASHFVCFFFSRNSENLNFKIS